MSVFDPLTPVKESVLVSFGATWDVFWQGGPKPSPRLDPLRAVLAPGAPAKVSVSRLAGGRQRHGFRVQCLALGCQTLELSLLADGSSSDPTPDYAGQLRSTARFCCKHPHSARLAFTLRPGVSAIVSDNRCSDLPASPVLTRRPFQAQAVCRDLDGVLFDNASTIDAAWTKSVDDTYLHFGASPMGVFPGRILNPLAVSPAVLVNATLTGYTVAEAPALPAPVTAIHRLHLADQHTVEPAAAILYNQPSGTPEEAALVRGGSGVFSLAGGKKGQQAGVAALSTGRRSEAGNRLVTVEVKHAGVLRLTVDDLCVVEAEAQRPDVHVADAAEVRVTARDLVQVEHSVIATVCVFDSRHVEFMARQYPLLDIQLRGRPTP